MKNVTIALDDETHRLARIRAAELGTSLSAMVKDYLTGLSREDRPVAEGVRDMHANFSHFPVEPVAPSGPPWLVDGKWVFTKDGKPRKPGALKHMWVADDFDEWPEGFLDAMLGEDTPASDQWWRTANDVLKTPKAK